MSCSYTAKKWQRHLLTLSFRYPEALADKSFDNTGRENLPWIDMQYILDWLNRFSSPTGSAV